MTGDETKLPRWARDLLVGLRNENAELTRALATARGVAADGATGRVIADCLGRDGFPLHDRAQVTFNLPGGKVSCMLRENGTILDINSVGTLHILPRASNSAWVKVER